MQGIFAAVVIGPAKHWKDKQQVDHVDTPAVIDGVPVSLPRNGLAPMKSYLVYGDLRTFDRRTYFKGPVEVVPVADVTELAVLFTAAGQDAGKAAG